jgi:hypothetical protein
VRTGYRARRRRAGLACGPSPASIRFDRISGPMTADPGIRRWQRNDGLGSNR